MSEKLKNIITLGGHSRIKNEVNELKIVIEKLNELFAKHENKKELINKKLDDIVELKSKALNEISIIKEITTSISLKDRKIIDKHIKEKDYSIDDIEKRMNEYEKINKLGEVTFKNFAISGLSTGATYNLVGSIGAASTGTAISTLSGAARTNATLAWFGGGSITSGGAGIIGGTLALGGIFIITPVLITSLLQYKKSLKKVKEIKEKKIEIQNHIVSINKNIIIFDIIDKKTDELTKSINKSILVFHKTYNLTYSRLFRYGGFSKFLKKLKKRIFNIPEFNKKDVREISYLLECTSNITKIIDTKIL